jgi:Ser/Thr protein kinase RdoA (MazF antagonist)
MLEVLSEFTEDHLLGVAKNFLIDGVFQSFETHGNGNVNDTYLLYYDSADCVNRYTLQRINHEVFKNPVGLMENFSRVTRHLQEKLANVQSNLQSLSLISTNKGKSFHQDSEGNYWRVTKFIDGGRSFDVPENIQQAYQAAKAFGEFQFNLTDLPGDPLVDTIPDFHNTRMRFEDLLSAVERDKVNRVAEVVDLIDFAVGRESLSDKIKCENFPLRVVHNDTKLNNVLLHKTTGEGMCVVDLDTVMPGCALHDFGDLVRTAACSAFEDEIDLDKVRFEADVFVAIVRGYLESAGNMLDQIEIEHLALAPQVITYELGLRFLTDYLDGDPYFKINRPGHNLDRTRAQFKLLTSLEEHFSKMEEIVREFSSSKAFA